VLWERWFPDEPCFEILDKRIAQGYEDQTAGDCAAAADAWLRAWQDVPALARKLNTREMTAFDEAVGSIRFSAFVLIHPLLHGVIVQAETNRETTFSGAHVHLSRHAKA
jgi:hypothetical protein